MRRRTVLKELEIEPLTEAWPLSNFDCGDEELNQYLREDALDHQRKLLGQTSLFIFRAQIVGFYTLCCATIKLEKPEKHKVGLEKISFKQIPAIKIGQFAVHKEYQRMRVGTEMISCAISGARKYCSRAGCRFVIVDAHNKEEVISFYERNGFTKNESPESNKTTISMRFDLWNER